MRSMFKKLYGKIAKSNLTKSSILRKARRFALMHLIRQPVLVNNAFYMFIEEHQPLNIPINKTYEPRETMLVNKVLEKDMIGLNIGANMGYYSLLLAKKCSKVYAIEPNPRFYNILEKNIQVNKLEKKIMPYNIAMDRKKSYIKFKAPVGDGIIDTISIKAEDLDTFFRGKEQPDIIVMDVDGAEGKILAGGKRTFINAKHIFFENNLGPAFLKKFERLGFEVRSIDQYNFYAKKGA